MRCKQEMCAEDLSKDCQNSSYTHKTTETCTNIAQQDVIEIPKNGTRDAQKAARNSDTVPVSDASKKYVQRNIGKTAVTAEPHKAEPRHANKKAEQDVVGIPKSAHRSTNSITNPKQGPAVRCVQ